MHSMDWATTPPLSWRVEEVEAWLGAVGLPHLAPAFRKGEGAPRERSARGAAGVCC